MNSEEAHNVRLSENIILADADYIDYVAFQLSVQFERMLGRRIAKADLSQWAVDIALDGGLRADGKAHETQLVLVHEKQHPKLSNFTPSIFETELNGQAFNDKALGEFLVNAYAVGDVVSKDDYMLDTVSMVLGHDEVKRLMIIPNGEQGTIYEELAAALRNAPEDKHITIFAMQPMAGGNFRQEILGYSLMNALGIKAGEIHPE
ncbi:hypothetical protein PRBRB14_08650 [Hallella multisaccharivorax DSM 17128]|uniref:Uncharacterized protein n=2 Tax=Hallella multisaccharivorax TaxID=310514 RepID=F8N818_9BACT|nr:DUF6621 family protein [Hallella multisaccharivorax]EGN56456.1 hypothetical protein Premu_1014 [Hallella multisaccharivorax DSM 17128]GJG29986.1 hypothetical protein PRBRB14_08650 [Hallella multisaccharivorax DSM 17128]